MKDIIEGLDIPNEVQETLVQRIEEAKKSWIEGAQNDPEFIKTLKSSETGKFYSSMERVYGRNFADLDMDKYKDLNGIKKMEAILKDGLDSITQTKDQTNQEWQKKYIDAQAENKRILEEELPTKLMTERESFYQRFIGDEILKDSLQYETVCSNDARVPLVNAYLTKNNYKTRWNNETGTYEIQTADGLKVTKDDKILTNEEIIRESFEFNGVLVKNNGKPEEIRNPGEGHVVKSNGKLSPNAQRILDTMTTK